MDMEHHDTHSHSLPAFVRTSTFYGQLLDRDYFDCEQRYFLEKISLLNRMVVGYGVICGLDVRLCHGGKGVIVTPGAALDRRGRVIVVGSPSKPVDLPAPPEEPKDPKQTDYDQDDRHGHNSKGRWAHVVICYHECAARPEPVMAPSCEGETACAPGRVEERYKIEVRPGRAPHIGCESRSPDFVQGGRINYPALATWITQNCPSTGGDVCIPLANIRLRGEGCGKEDVDITIRPIVYTNDLLWDLICGLLNEAEQPRGGKA
jgi:hypothetical protein